MNSIPWYILESTLTTQQLWFATAGQRPKQPQSEREYFECLYKKNFQLSEIPQAQEKAKKETTAGPRDQRSKTYPLSIKENKEFGEDIPRVYFGKEFNGEILGRGTCQFSNTVSKTFKHHNVTMTMEIPRFRIVQSFDGHDPHVEFLVIVTTVRGSSSHIGSHSAAAPVNGMMSMSHSTENHSSTEANFTPPRRRSDIRGEYIPPKNHMTYGIWRRHGEFHSLASILANRFDCTVDSTTGKLNSFQNALLSWQCVIHRKQWFRCFDKEYLSIKCFLLERFMHDVLFESNNPDLLSEFLLSPTPIII